MASDAKTYEVAITAAGKYAIAQNVEYNATVYMAAVLSTVYNYPTDKVQLDITNRIVYLKSIP